MSLQIGIVGTGYIAAYHARAIRAAGCRVGPIVGSSLPKAEAFAAEHGAAGALATVEDLAADASTDAAVIATPNALHRPQSLALFAGGKHVLVEKPMALDAAEGEAMVAAARAADRRLMVGHMWRFDREALRLREAVAAGALGRIVKAKAYGIHALWGPGGWFVRKAEAGGGALIDMGVHALDTLRFLLGDPQPLRVYARISTEFGSYDVDDLGVLVVDWAGGCTSIIESGWWNPHMDGAEASTQLFGTAGYGRLFPTDVVRTASGTAEPAGWTFPARAEHCDQHIYDGQLAAFVEAIAAGRDRAPGPDEGLTILRLCDAAYESARRGEAITLAG